MPSPLCLPTSLHSHLNQDVGQDHSSLYLILGQIGAPAGIPNVPKRPERSSGFLAAQSKDAALLARSGALRLRSGPKNGRNSAQGAYAQVYIWNCCLPSSLVQQAIARLLLEASAMDVQPLSEAIVMESLPHISKHNVNASDALYLHQVILLKNLLRRVGHDVILVASDRRLVRAATVEGISVLDPEIAIVADVGRLIG